MSKMLCRSVFGAISAALLVVMSASAAPPADWSSIPVQTVNLFYPGQSSYQWLRSPQHKGQALTAQGGACVTCHKGQEAQLGQNIVSGKSLEPHPIAGKPAVIALAVQAAYDVESVYFRFQWKTHNAYAGSAHPHWRFDGKDWKAFGWPQLHEKVWKDGKPAIYEDRLSLIIDDGGVRGFAQQGCWLSCHDGSRDMANLATPEQVKAHALLGQVLNKSDVRKYLPGTRTDDNSSWDKTKSADEIAKLLQAGEFLDLMQWRAHRSNPVGMADDGYVLEYRLSDGGVGVFAANWDKKNGQPKYMFDQSKVGFKATTMSDLRDPLKAPSLIAEQNAIAFDANVGWKEGDLIPEYYLTRAGASGSAADNARVTGIWKDGMWTVEWVRRLDTGHVDDKVLKANGVVQIGLAVHDDNITTRGHHVSWPLTLGLGAKADITAVKID